MLLELIFFHLFLHWSQPFADQVYWFNVVTIST